MSDLYSHDKFLMMHFVAKATPIIIINSVNIQVVTEKY